MIFGQRVDGYWVFFCGGGGRAEAGRESKGMINEMSSDPKKNDLQTLEFIIPFSLYIVWQG